MSATDVLQDTETTDIEFLDELPKIHRKVESGVWVKRLQPLRDNPGKWAKVYGPTNSPHALVNNLRGGSAAGIDADEFQFAGRMLPTGETDEDGNPTKAGFVFAKFLTEDEREARAAGLIEDEDEDE